MKVKSQSKVTQLYLTLSDPWTAAYQAPVSMGFSRQEYWSGVGAIAFSVLTPYIEVNSKWIKGLNLRPETIKFLEEIIDSTFFDVNDHKILFE